MRITEQQLRRIIREERARLRGRRLNESFNSEQLMRMGTGGAAMATAVDDLRGDWMGLGQADPAQPVDHAGWELQVDEAISSLVEQIMNAVDEVEEGLINGDYA